MTAQRIAIALVGLLVAACSHDLDALIATNDGGSETDSPMTVDATRMDAPMMDSPADAGADAPGLDTPPMMDSPSACTVGLPVEEFVGPDGQTCWDSMEAYLARMGGGASGNYRGHVTTACLRWTSSLSGPTHFTVILEAVDSACGNICSTGCETGHAVEAWDDVGFIATYPISRDLTMLEVPSRDDVLVLCRMDFPAEADHIRIALITCRAGP